MVKGNNEDKVLLKVQQCLLEGWPAERDTLCELKSLHKICEELGNENG